MTNQTKSLNTQEWVPQSLDVIAGLFDSDGSFGVKTYIGKEGVKFHTNITYSQELLKRDALYGLLLYMGVESEVKISTRNVPSKITGTISTGTSISLAFSSDSGQVLLNRWATIPPCAPSKILDYNIATLLTQLSSVKADVLINRYVNQNIVTDTPIAELACLWLRTKMSGVQRDVKNKKPLKEYYLKLSATKGEIQKSVVIAKTVFEKMQKTIDNQNAQIEQRLTEDYIVGYFIGDGSFSFSHSFNENGNLKFTSAFTITDSVQNFALLKATSKFLVSLGCSHTISIYNKGGAKQLSLGGQKSLLFFKRWSKYKFPEYKQNQYDKMMRALDILNTPNFRKDLTLLEELINIKWSMNYATNYKKKGSLKSDLAEIRVWRKQWCETHKDKQRIRKKK